MNLSYLADSGTSSGGISGWAIHLMDTLGAFGAGVAIAVENLFPPLPSELILPLAGFTASKGQMSLWAVLLWTTAGSLVGAITLFWIGAWLGPQRIRAIAARLPLIKVADVDKSEAWFQKHGTKAVFFGRMVPIFRSLISIPAGIAQMPKATFLILTTLGSLIWNTSLVLMGYLLGENWHTVEDTVGLVSKVVIGTCIVIVAIFLIRRTRHSRGARNAIGPHS